MCSLEIEDETGGATLFWDRGKFFKGEMRMVWFPSPVFLLKSCQVTDIISSLVNLKGYCGSSRDESLSKIKCCHDIRPRLYFLKLVGISYNFGYNFCRILSPNWVVVIWGNRQCIMPFFCVPGHYSSCIEEWLLYVSFL